MDPKIPNITLHRDKITEFYQDGKIRLDDNIVIDSEVMFACDTTDLDVPFSTFIWKNPGVMYGTKLTTANLFNCYTQTRILSRSIFVLIREMILRDNPGLKCLTKTMLCYGNNIHLPLATPHHKNADWIGLKYLEKFEPIAHLRYQGKSATFKSTRVGNVFNLKFINQKTVAIFLNGGLEKPIHLASIIGTIVTQYLTRFEPEVADLQKPKFFQNCTCLPHQKCRQQAYDLEALQERLEIATIEDILKITDRESLLVENSMAVGVQLVRKARRRMNGFY